jgi:hypothetical protein
MSEVMKEFYELLNESEETPAADAGDNTEGNADDNNEEPKLTEADEAAIFLAALADATTPEEYQKIAIEAAVELELFGLIPSASVATESRKYVVKMEKQNDMNREEKKACLRLAKAKNDPDWVIYAKARKLMIEKRHKLFAKYASQAKQVAKKVLQNSRRKASNMNSSAGKSIVDRMDKKIAEANKRND